MKDRIFPILSLLLILKGTTLHSESSQKIYWKNWDNSIYCSSPVSFYAPHSPQEIPLTGGPYRIIGSNHSWNEAFCQFKGVISTQHFTKAPQIVKFKNNYIVKVGSGVLLKDLLDFLEKHGRSLETFPDIPYVTVGGAVATASHGTSFKQGTLSDSLIGVKVTPSINKKTSLHAYATNVGKLGVITELQLKTIPNEILECHVDTISTSTFIKEWKNFQAENKRFQAWYDFTTKTAMIYRYNDPGSIFKKLPAKKTTGYLTKILKTLKPKTIGTLKNLMLVFPLEPRLEAEYIVNQSKALPAILGLERFLIENKIKLMRPMFIRFGGTDHLGWLSPANFSEPVVFLNIDLLHGQEDQLKKIEKYLITNFSARFHWGKWYSHNTNLMKKAYGKHLDLFNTYQNIQLKNLYGIL